ncbi:MAG: DUF1343 domain-containing protein [Cyclobacteriaceae bacterium]|nr:DUF1343 domain-containing protein [Cyclobacteriaceae bacterium]
MIRIIGLSAFLWIGAMSCDGQTNDKILLGAEQLDLLASKLQGQRVALLVNHTSQVGHTHLADTLLSLGLNLVKIFSPEHGFRGQAADGEKINNSIDEKTGLPIVSLYGNAKKPTSEQLKDVDVVIFDIQDVGVRFYTYISSLYYMLEACGENNKTVMVLDRPNPNSFVDGPMLEPEFKSFVGIIPIPIAHGMTVGELATMMLGEKWLKDGIQCKLEIIPMKNYSHNMSYVLPLKPSPNLPTQNAITWYPSLCLFEGTVVSVGRGTSMPFEVIGNPKMKEYPFKFTPVSTPGMSNHPPHENQECYGLDLRNTKPESNISLKYLIAFYNKYPDKDQFFTPYFNTLAGTGTLKEQIISGMSEDEIKLTWQKGLNAFKAKRSKYLLYK